MGMYDYLGSEQVKCFYVPIVHIDKNIMGNFEDIVSVSASGGRLRYFRRGSVVPYKTLYTNYGPNFIVYDFRGFNEDDENLIHIIRKGRYKRSVSINHIPLRYSVENVVDNYGRPLNIHSREDFLKIFEDFKKYHKLYRDLTKESNEVMNEIMDKYRENTISSEDLTEIMDKVKADNDIAFENSLQIFNNLWRLEEDNRGWVIGGILDNFSLDYKKEHDKYLIINQFLNDLEKSGETLDNLIKEYCDWCKENEVPCSQLEIEGVFAFYSQEMPENVRMEYELEKEKKRC